MSNQGFYIVFDHNPRHVWNHRLRRVCMDYDAEYDWDFGYHTHGRAVRVAAHMVRPGCTRAGREVLVYSREVLFRALGVRDWSRGK